MIGFAVIEEMSEQVGEVLGVCNVFVEALANPVSIDDGALGRLEWVDGMFLVGLVGFEPITKGL